MNQLSTGAAFQPSINMLSTSQKECNFFALIWSTVRVWTAIFWGFQRLLYKVAGTKFVDGLVNTGPIDANHAKHIQTCLHPQPPKKPPRNRYSKRQGKNGLTNARWVVEPTQNIHIHQIASFPQMFRVQESQTSPFFTPNKKWHVRVTYKMQHTQNGSKWKSLKDLNKGGKALRPKIVILRFSQVVKMVGSNP